MVVSAIAVRSTVEAVRSTVEAVFSAVRAPASVVGTPVIERVAPGIVTVVVIDHGSVMPIASPMIPAPAKASEPTDSESEPE
jgi:microcompartment protein CcmL/EutN